MEDYRIKIKLKSLTGTYWQSDTIFGHLCWQVAYGVLDVNIEDFLKPFRERKPPFVLSDGFPEGLLPRPMLALKLKKAKTPEEYNEVKRKKKAPYYKFDDFLTVCRGGEMKNIPPDNPWRPIITLHASIDRITNTTGEKGESSGLYETRAYSLDGSGILEIYLRCEEGWEEKVMKLLSAVSKTGFGKDKSVGLGAFEIVDIKKFDRFGSFDDANGFVSLSSMVPAADDPTDARYRLRTKYGKLGEGIFGNPFKKPLLQMEPGAVFKTDDPVKDYYGRMIEGIAPGDERVVQNCYAFSVPCMVKD